MIYLYIFRYKLWYVYIYICIIHIHTKETQPIVMLKIWPFPTWNVPFFVEFILIPPINQASAPNETFAWKKHTHGPVFLLVHTQENCFFFYPLILDEIKKPAKDSSIQKAEELQIRKAQLFWSWQFPSSNNSNVQCLSFVIPGWASSNVASTWCGNNIWLQGQWIVGHATGGDRLRGEGCHRRREGRLLAPPPKVA